MALETKDSSNETTPIQARLELSKKVEHEYEEASKLLRRKLYKESLRKYKWVFSQEATADLFLDAREIMTLLKGYPPAITILKRWRNDKEKLIRSEKCDLPLIRQWRDLNECLGEKERTLEVFLEMREAGADERTLRHLLSNVWERFAKAKNYEALKNYLPSLGTYILLHAMEYDAAILFPRDESKGAMRWDIEYHTDYMLNDGTLSYEVALGVRMKLVASEFAKKILGVETSDRAYAGLIRSAIRARCYDEAIALFTEAKIAFGLRRLRKSLKAIRRLPKSRLAQVGLKPAR